MNNTCLVTTVIPVYNTDKYLRQTLDSVMEQSSFIYRREILLIDDGSTDRSGKICDEYAARYKDIRVFHLKNGGAAHARNFGLKNAQGKYIHFMDADDIIDTEMYSEFSEAALRDDPDAVICGVKRTVCGMGQSKKKSGNKTEKSVIIGPEKDRTIEKTYLKEFVRQIRPVDERWLLDYIWDRWYKVELLKNRDNLGFVQFDESMSLGEDFDFNCRALAAADSITFLKKPFYTYMVRSSGLVNGFHENPWDWREKQYQSHCLFYQSYDCLDKEREEKIRIFQGQLDFGAFRSINNQRCPLNRNEKTAFIRTFSKSRQYENMLFFLKSEKGKRRIFFCLLWRRNAFGIWILLQLDRYQRIRGRY